MLEIDTVSAHKNGLTLAEYLFIKAKLFGYEVQDLEFVVPSLREKQWLIPGEGILLNRSRCGGLWDEADLFWELFSLYPMKVPNGRGGTRSLRAKSPDSKDAKENHRRFLIACPTKEHQQTAISITEKFIQENKTADTLMYLPALETYINGRDWEKYEYLLDDESSGEGFSTYV